MPGDGEADDIARTLQEIKDAGLCMEINTSGYRHAELPEPQPYPMLPIVEQSLALGIPLTVNSDAHLPEQVGMQFGTVERFLKRKGGRELAKFVQRKREMYEF
jgi:histidinol-phosphatase (PHP family)